MKIHREGIRPLIYFGIVLGILCGIALRAMPRQISGLLVSIAALFYIFLLRFYRNPIRATPMRACNVIIAPASGVIVAVESVSEAEYFQDERLKISIFLSNFNVHMTVAPVHGQVIYRRYHAGKYLVAFHPKASLLNERSTVIFQTNDGQEILIRQIAGIVARRIVTYPQVGERIQQGQDIGFIHFGSRVDVFLPLSSEVMVKVGDAVRIGQSELALLDLPTILADVENARR